MRSFLGFCVKRSNEHGFQVEKAKVLKRLQVQARRLGHVGSAPRSFRLSIAAKLDGPIADSMAAARALSE